MALGLLGGQWSSWALALSSIFYETVNEAEIILTQVSVCSLLRRKGYRGVDIAADCVLGDESSITLEDNVLRLGDDGSRCTDLE